MTVRTTEEAVGLIIELDEEIDLAPFMETANYLVDAVCLDSNYPEVTLELIERWLTAHFYAIRDPRTVSEGVRGITERFEGQTKTGLWFTRYGQMAMLLDVDGNLKALDADQGKIKAEILHVGGQGSICDDTTCCEDDE
jgi:hypothetical protein